jgi:plastocyanin
MSRRFALRAALTAAIAFALVSGAASATAKSVTIHATPNPVVTGDPVLIYGQLNAPNHAGRRVVLWHRIAGQARFTPISVTHTGGTGFYFFRRAEGIVRTNRNWFVRSAGVRSRIVHERVFAEVTLNQPSGTLLTLHPVTFTGTVTPGGVHVGDRVVLQGQSGPNGDRWHAIDSGRVHPGGGYTIVHRFRQPGSRSLRTLLRRDRYNLASSSTPISIDVQQAQNLRFTLTASSTSINEGESVTLSGTLASPKNGGQTVELFARSAGRRWQKVGSTVSGSDGSYSFTQTPVHNTIYQARAGARRHSARVFVGVRDVVTIQASSTTAKVGDTVTFTGAVSPSHVGHVIYLQRLGDDSAFHTVQVRRIGPGGYTFTHTFASTGTKVFRVVVPGGPANQRGVSSTVTITVS